ncbi:MAG: helix-turn-helix transcriptional regulator [Gaiellaceae bacterium]
MLAPAYDLTWTSSDSEWVAPPMNEYPNDTLPTPFERARTELAWGERLRRSGRRTDARRRLNSALQVFDRLGAAPWAERARGELRASGQSVRTPEQLTEDALTPQELQVAAIVAGGATNKEAAAALFLSVKTIEFHLGHVYRKLGIRSRTELARVIDPPLEAEKDNMTK